MLHGRAPLPTYFPLIAHKHASSIFLVMIGTIITSEGEGLNNQ